MHKLKLHRLRLVITLLVILSVQASGQNSTSTTVTSLEDIYAMAAKAENLRSLLISKDDKIITERYYDRYSTDSLDHLRSATKSIMATLIGIGIDKGFIGSVEDPISKYIPETPTDKKEIRIKHLMGMTSGLKWSEGDGYNDHNTMIDSGNPLKHMMALPMAHKPGTKWEYSSGDIHLLSVILSNASKMNTYQFAQKYFFGPLGITDLQWQTFGDGYTAGGSRLQLKPRDMMKIGQMLAQGGVYKGNQIISKGYLEMSTNVQYQHNLQDGVSEGYGYGWWTVNINGSKIYLASGYGGQSIIVIPENKIVVVTTHKWKVNGQMALAQQRKSQDIAQEVWKWANAN